MKNTIKPRTGRLRAIAKWAASVGLTIAITLVVASAEATAHTDAGVRKPGPTITVMSYNILHGEGLDRKYNLNRVATVIADSHADIVGLQEVDAHWSPGTNFDHQARRLAEQLHMNYAFAPIYSGPPGVAGLPNREHGVAILTKYPIISTVNHPIPRLSTIERALFPGLYPGLANTVIRVGQVPVRVYNTHLDYRRNPWVRRLQITEMMNIMRPDPPNQILLGDLNATPDSPEMAPLLQRFHSALAGCTDCKSYHSAAPTRLIDYILVSPAIEVKRSGVIASTASDHRPVMATVTLSAVRDRAGSSSSSDPTAKRGAQRTIPQPAPTRRRQ